MIEQEAKTKWCPFARVVVPLRSNATGEFFAACAGNRVGISDQIAIMGSTERDNPESARCIGSACMSWRWEDDDAYMQRLTEWEDAANIGGVQRGQEPMRQGHCGLAGRP